MFVGQFGSFIGQFLVSWKGSIKECDVFVTNDVYEIDGAVTHLNDVIVLLPIHYKGETSLAPSQISSVMMGKASDHLPLLAQCKRKMASWYSTSLEPVLKAKHLSTSSSLQLCPRCLLGITCLQCLILSVLSIMDSMTSWISLPLRERFVDQCVQLQSVTSPRVSLGHLGTRRPML